MTKILQKENRILRQIARPVTVEKIETPEIKKIIRTMKEAMHREEDAVAIAAPQIGKLLRIFVICSKVFARKEGAQDKKEPEVEKSHHNDIVFINPEIINQSKQEGWIEEGCLSIRWWYGLVERAGKITVRALDENGHVFTRGASALPAQIVQHEIDHLDGILFTDKAKYLKEIKPTTKSPKTLDKEGVT